ncbi:MAG: ABC transporter substrate-binding protein, partial [Patescibacteria group bacterium]
MKNRIKEALGRTYRVPGVNLIETTIKSFTLAEKVIFAFFSLILIFSSLGLLYKLSTALSVEVPSYGGEIIEGVTGFPRFVNPLLAISDADKDLTSVIYSGLTRTSNGGEITNDLAESFDISEDGKTYTFVLKDGAEFHDGTDVTAEDIVFTIKSVQNELLKSPKRPNWIGVEVEAINEKAVVFTLKQPYAPFLENTNLGILPKHIWKDLDAEQFPFSQFNIEPIGSGPYKVSKIKRNSSGVADYYELKSFRKFALGKPYINVLKFKFFTNEEELLRVYLGGGVDNINSISPSKARELEQQGKNVVRVPLSRIFGLFLNQNQKQIFANKEARIALNKAIDKTKIVNEALYGYATAINSPIPPGILNAHKQELYSKGEARAILEKGGWKWNEGKGVWQKKIGKNTEDLTF